MNSTCCAASIAQFVEHWPMVVGSTLILKHQIFLCWLVFHIVGTVGSGTVGSGTVGSGTVGSGMDADYISVMSTLVTFTNGQTRQCFNVTIVDDTEVELTEDFFASLTLIPASVTTINSSRITVAPAQATVNITDNDLRK